MGSSSSQDMEYSEQPKQVVNQYPQQQQVQQYSDQQQQKQIVEKQEAKKITSTNQGKIEGQQYANDDLINVQAYNKQNQPDKKAEYNLEDILKFEIKSMTKTLKLSSSKTETVPVMISLKTNLPKNEEVEKKLEESRPSIDLICVIDRSGSMAGKKIELVKDALRQLLEMLNDNDRVSLVIFDHDVQVLCPLKKVTKENLTGYFQQVINKIQVRGGTNIGLGMSEAFKILQQRKYKNQVNSIFLLSDGLDGKGFENVQISLQKNQPDEAFTIHSYGFGEDHDPQMMNKISQLKDGSFYYVEKLEQVDEMFIDALGGLFSVVGQDVTITVKVNKGNQIFSDVIISKTFGSFWKVKEPNLVYEINLIQVLYGVSKDFILELSVPPISSMIQDQDRNSVLLKASLTISTIGVNKKQITRESELEMTIYNEKENIPQGANDDNVQVNYLRVQAADAMIQIKQNADKGKYEESQKIILDMKNKISTQNNAVQQRLLQIKDDLEEQKDVVNEMDYEIKGKKKIESQQRGHMEQRSYKMKNYDFNENFSYDQVGVGESYQNFTQERFVHNIQNKKYKSKKC